MLKPSAASKNVMMLSHTDSTVAPVQRTVALEAFGQ